MKDSKQTMRNLLWLLAALSILPFYLLVAFYSKSATGDAIQTGDISFTVSVEEGVAMNPLYTIPLSVPADGSYQFDLDWTCEEPGFITGCVVKRPDDTPVFGFCAASITGNSNTAELPAGKNIIEYHFITDAEELRSFCSAYIGMSEKEIDSFLQQIDFTTFTKNGDWTFSLKAYVYEMQPAPAILLFVAILCGVISLLLLFFLLYFIKDMKEQTGELPSERNLQLGRVGLRHTVFATVVSVSQIALLFFLRTFAQETAAALGTNLTFLLVILTVDVIGFPLTYLLYKKVPKTQPTVHPLGVKNFLLFVLMGAGLCGIGGILGNLIHRLLTIPFGAPSAGVGDLIMLTDMPLRILAVGILAPIFEELIFRKLLIDHLYKYGEFFAIAASGLTFGMFHGNFQQAIYATLLGFLWAFVYVRTGKIRYSIAMHMVINMSTSAITVYLLGKFMEYGPSDASDIGAMIAAMEASPECLLYSLLYSGWMILLLLCGLAGAIILIVFLSTGKFKLRRLEGEPEKKVLVRELLCNKYMWLFYLACLGLFLINYLPPMLP